MSTEIKTRQTKFITYKLLLTQLKIYGYNIKPLKMHIIYGSGHWEKHLFCSAVEKSHQMS